MSETEHTVGCATNAPYEDFGYLGCTCGADKKNLEKMTFGSLKEANRYFKKLPGGKYTICVKENFAIIDERLREERQQEAAAKGDVCSNIPYLRTNGEFL